MVRKSNICLSFDPDAWELSVVAHRPRNWLPISSRRGMRHDSARLASVRPPLAPSSVRPLKQKKRLLISIATSEAVLFELAKLHIFRAQSGPRFLAARLEADG